MQVFVVSVWAFLVIGWFINLFSVISTAFSGVALAEISVFFVLQGVGIFAGPIGSVLGWISLFL